MSDLAKRLANYLKSAHSAVFFGGAGVSTESGIPDFRSTDGLYSQKWRYPPETILSHSFWQRCPEEFYRFYREKLIFPDARPNNAHKALARLEEAGLLDAVITQNIDGLHQAAGSKNVIELHGTVLENKCTRCGRKSGPEAVLSVEGVPKCACGGIIKPEVVLYEEALPSRALERASLAVEKADLMIVGGTSLSVWPAAGFVQSFSGTLVIINRSPTPQDRRADLVITDSVGSVLKEAADLVL